MDILATIAERKIREAISRGDFDDLPLKGQPIPREEFSDVPEELRMGYKVLKNAGMLPEELELRREILTLQDLIAGCECEKSQEGGKEQNLRRRLSLKQLHYDILRERNAASPDFRRYQSRIERKLGLS